MSCQCYQIGGPFIAEDPDCPAHGAGGYQDQVEVLEGRVERLEEQIRALGQEPVT
jgi:hypothetical protein